jgi:hypothetical protein
MGIESFLTEQDKLASLNKVKSLTSIEIYKLCLRLGIDPDGFDYETYETPVFETYDPSMVSHPVTLKNYCDNLKLVMAKIEAINNA